jgi:hypothetical protein
VYTITKTLSAGNGPLILTFQFDYATGPGATMWLSFDVNGSQLENNQWYFGPTTAYTPSGYTHTISVISTAFESGGTYGPGTYTFAVYGWTNGCSYLIGRTSDTRGLFLVQELPASGSF